MNKFKKGDKVIVIQGRDKGKQGEILKVLLEKKQVVVSDVNMVKKHQAATKESKGGILDKSMPLSWSNIMHVTASGDKSRIGFKITKKGKVRYTKKDRQDFV